MLAGLGDISDWDAIKVSESSVSRAISESKDLELKIMLQTVERIDMIRKYSR